MPTLSAASQRGMDTLLNAARDFSVSEINTLKKLMAEFSGGDTQSAYSSGTNYTFTTTAAAVAHGTTSPTITFAREGTYELEGWIKLDAVGATTTNQSAVIKLRRTNNTATDVANSSTSVRLPIMTTATQTIDTVRMAPQIVTVNAGDTYTIFANIDTALGAGTIQSGQSALVAIRLY